MRILIADDHAMIRNALAFLVNAQPDMDVVADAADGHEAFMLVENNPIDILLMDISMPPGENGLLTAKRIKETFDGDFKINFNLAPPMFSKKDSNGHLVKQQYGPWVFKAFKLLAKLKGLRGGTFDVFGKTEERKMERQLIVDYRSTLEELINGLNNANYELAVDIAKVPEHIRGYGHVKEEHFAKAKARKDDLLLQWRNPEPDRAVA